MKSKGYNISQSEYKKYMAEQYRLGIHIVNYELPKFLRFSVIPYKELVYKMSILEPIYYSKLPYLAAFGYTQGILIHQIRNGNKNIEKMVGLSSSILNIGMCFFDHLIDETSNREDIFKIVNCKLLCNIMDLSFPKSSFNSINIYMNKTLDEREYFLLWLIFAFTISCRQIYEQSRNDKAWQQLATSIFQMYDAEKLSSELRTHNINMRNWQYLDIVKHKSVIPSLCIYYISQLSTYDISELQDIIKDICNTIGSIFWISDDLADAIKDLKTGSLSYITLNLSSLPYRSNNFCDEEHFCKVLISGIEFLLNLFEKIDREIKLLSISANTYNSIIQFLRMSVASWIK